MSSGLPTLPARQIENLLASYGNAVARRRRQSILVLGTLAVLAVAASRFAEVDIAHLLHHLSGLTSYFGRILPKLRSDHLTGDIADWYWNALGWLKLLFDTVLIAYLATLTAATAAGAMAFLAAANVAPSGILRWCVKRLFEFCRTVPDLVFALIFGPISRAMRCCASRSTFGPVRSWVLSARAVSARTCSSRSVNSIPP